MLPAAILLASMLSSVDGVNLFYTTAGKGSTIVVVHGGPGMDHNSLAADLEPLTRKHRLVYYDQRGGGRSTLPADTKLLTIGRHVEDLEALRRQLGIEKMTILAHSFGPAIAALYAIEYPQHVDRMIFLAPIPPRKGKFFEEFGATMKARLTAEQQKRGDELQKSFATAKDIAAVCREYWSIMTPPRVSRSLPASVVKSDFCTAPPEAIRYGMTKTNPVTFTSLGDWDWTADLARVTAPVLIIHGQEDAIPMAMVEVWAKALPNATLVKVPGAAHFPYAERPELVYPAIDAFLGSAGK